MKSFFKKLKSKAGESLIETLAAILVFTMASIVMFTLVNTAGELNATAKEMDKQNQLHMIAVEKGESSALNGSAIVTFKLGEDPIAWANVDIYGGKDDSLFTYFIHTTPQGGAGG